MSYSYENLAVDHSKMNCMQKCFYVMNLIKAKSPKVWEKYRSQFETLKVEESWDFYQTLVSEYRQLLNPPKTTKKAEKIEKPTPIKQAPVKAAKKAPAKKSAPAKKKTAVKKKTEKKSPAKKKSAVKKKAAKKK